MNNFYTTDTIFTVCFGNIPLSQDFVELQKAINFCITNYPNGLGDKLVVKVSKLLSPNSPEFSVVDTINPYNRD
jgi:hypothetical protein